MIFLYVEQCDMTTVHIMHYAVRKSSAYYVIVLALLVIDVVWYILLIMVWLSPTPFQ